MSYELLCWSCLTYFDDRQSVLRDVTTETTGAGIFVKNGTSECLRIQHRLRPTHLIGVTYLLSVRTFSKTFFIVDSCFFFVNLFFFYFIRLAVWDSKFKKSVS